MNNIKEGDIMENKWGDFRIITAVNDKGCYFVDYKSDPESYCPGYFYNPCNSFVIFPNLA